MGIAVARMENINFSVNGCKCSSLEDVSKCASKEFYTFIASFVDSEKYIVAHTSGSTGEPKAIHLLKEDMRRSAALTNKFFSLSSDSLFYLSLSPTYIAGKMMIVRALELNASIIEEIPSNTPLAEYEGRSIDIAAFVPSQLNYLFNNPHKLALIKAMIIGGAKMSSRIERRIADMGLNAYATYGMTETCSHVALAKITSPVEPFRALDNVSFSTDDRGCLVISAPHLSEKIYTTNDMVDIISPTQFIWQGRYDNVINTGGIKVFPEEIEHKIAHLIPKSKFFISSQSSEKWGEEVILVIEYPGLKEGDKKEGEIRTDFIDKMKLLLPSYSIPRKWIAINKIAYTNSGKVIRKL